jgi:hypothetical protein
VFVRDMSRLWGLDCGPGRATGSGNNKDRFKTICPAPECGKEFAFEGGETRLFELPVSLFERRHFYRSELQ